MRVGTSETAWRILGTIGWIAIVILSLLPGSARPHSGASGFSEHFVAYAAVAFCLCHGLAHQRNRLIMLAILIGSSGFLEIVQLYIPGRTAELKGLLSAAAGAVLGAVATQLLSHLKFRT